VAFVLHPGVTTALRHALATGFAIDVRVMAVILPWRRSHVVILRLARRELLARPTLVAAAV